LNAVYWPDEKRLKQLIGRHGAGYIRHFMVRYRNQDISAAEAASELQISARRFRQLYASYLQAAATGQEASWSPGVSGGHRRRQVPDEVAKLWRRLLKAKPPATYSFAASEALRRFQYAVDRATVRRWAQINDLDVKKPPAQPRAPVRRWQCGRVGTLWQLDVSPHRWFSSDDSLRPLFDMLDDCSRMITGARLYEKENLYGYIDFLPRAFENYGLPLALYVDYHSFFFTALPDGLTYLGEALRFYDISFKYASSPRAKGKVERLHQLWQKRLPALFSAEGVRSVEDANPLIDELRIHRNQKEIHRELERTPQSAWDIARKQGRSDLRPKPRCPWWNYIWSIRTEVKVDVHGTVPAAAHRYRIETCAPKTALTRCEHRDGSFSFLLKPPQKGKRPIVVLRIEGQNPQGKF
jgi:hypothetical protein